MEVEMGISSSQKSIASATKGMTLCYKKLYICLFVFGYISYVMFVRLMITAKYNVCEGTYWP